jgi:cytochrome c-type biogenesis protein CcmH/NrfF
MELMDWLFLAWIVPTLLLCARYVLLYQRSAKRNSEDNQEALRVLKETKQLQLETNELLHRIADLLEEGNRPPPPTTN